LGPKWIQDPLGPGHQVGPDVWSCGTGWSKGPGPSPLAYSASLSWCGDTGTLFPAKVCGGVAQVRNLRIAIAIPR